jgi:tetratricopeptide (TPR) repeat protein
VPTLASVHYNLGTLWQRQKELDRAQQEYGLALKYALDERESAQTHNNLGVLFSQLGRRNEAVAEFTIAININPYEQNSFLGRGMSEQQENKLDLALDDFTHAAQISPSPLALYWRGRVLEQQGMNPEAAASYAAALQLAGDFADARTRLQNLQRAAK